MVKIKAILTVLRKSRTEDEEEKTQVYNRERGKIVTEAEAEIEVTTEQETDAY